MDNHTPPGGGDGGDKPEQDAGGKPTPKAALKVVERYNQNYERAVVRESVRAFTDTIREMWSGPVSAENEIKDNVPVFNLMRYKTLNRTRFRWASTAVFCLVICASVLAVIFLVATALLPSLDLTPHYKWIASGVVALKTLVASVLWYVTLKAFKPEIDNYRGGIQDLARTISQSITNFVLEQGGETGNVHVEAFVDNEDEQETIREGIVGAFRRWRAL